MRRDRPALAAVLLGQTGRPHGAPPRPEELAAWAAKRLSGPRLEEVESHIARDPAVFERAMACLREASGKRSAPDTSRRGWRALLTGPVPALAACAAAVALVAFWALRDPRLEGVPTGAPQSSPILRGDTPAPGDWRMVAFRAGYWQEQAADAAGRAEERTDAYGCVDEEGCAAQVEQLVRFGEALAQLNAACSTKLDEEQRTALAMELGDIEASMQDSLELLPWRGSAHELASDLARNAPGTCDRGAALRDLLIAD
jgi:hypothetical protein